VGELEFDGGLEVSKRIGETAKVGIGWEDYEPRLMFDSFGLEVGSIERTLSRSLAKPNSMFAQTDRFREKALKK
jgi:hypothetical protein